MLKKRTCEGVMTKDRFLDFCQLRWPVVRTDHIWCTDRCSLIRLNILVFSNQSRSQSSWAFRLWRHFGKMRRGRIALDSKPPLLISIARTDLRTWLFLNVIHLTNRSEKAGEHDSTWATCHSTTSLHDVPNTCPSNTSPCLHWIWTRANP